jgi:hypothetical protein
MRYKKIQLKELSMKIVEMMNTEEETIGENMRKKKIV